jgi:hypothetical protein
MRIFNKLCGRRNADALLLLLLGMTVPWATALADPDANVKASAHYMYFTDDFVEVWDEKLGNTLDGTVTRNAGLNEGCCGISAAASSTTSSANDASWTGGAAKSKSFIDVADWSYLLVPTTTGQIEEYYIAAATAEYIIPWQIESSTLVDGTEVEVNVRVLIDGILSFDFLSEYLEGRANWVPGDPITPLNFEGLLDHATVDVYVSLRATRLSTGSTNLVFSFDAVLDTYDLLTVDSRNEGYLTDESSIGENDDDPDAATLKYSVNIDKLITEVNFEEVKFFVGEVYELRLWLRTGASFARHHACSSCNFPFTMTSDFFNTASYEMVSPDGQVSFVALDSSETDPSTIDTDGDGVPDLQDVCPGGDDNTNTDGDLLPDFCDICPFDADNDADGDGVCGDIDVCPLFADASQADTDGDLMGDVCDVCPFDADNDIDGDGVCGDIDVCPILTDPGQTDTDGDSVGDACDFDDDNDEICDGANAVDTVCAAGPDNCPLFWNLDQADFDGDGAGDVCDVDNDNDNVADNIDACPMTVTGEVVDAGGCSVNDQCPCGNSWKNHGAYVRCVAHTSEDFIAAGLITEVEKDTIVSTAGISSCGAKK